MRGNVLILGLFVLLVSYSTPGTIHAGRIDGSCLESWELENFQPQSPTYQQWVGSTSYYPRTAVVMLLPAG